ncbi:MAG: SDR family oxidoreductase [Alphaproteobacteria bacterium]|nr:SDR family oxidoreductase [Alphaproteobacteria bacterium]
MSPGHLFLFGYGYVGSALARLLVREGWRVSATTRSTDKMSALRADKVEAHLFGPGGLRDPEYALASVTHILCTAAPAEQGDPALLAHGDMLRSRPPQNLRWLGYVSTTGVYGDAGGAWVDETAPLAPVHERGRRRVAAEQAWAELGEWTGAALCVFRLPGIYGPGRSAFDALRAGTAKRLVKPGQVFSRVHVDDAAAAMAASLPRSDGLIVNLADDTPAPPQDVVTYAAELMGVAPPPEEPYAAAEARLSPMAREFYGASRRISNALMKVELGVRPRYPSYREGLRAILAGTH